MPLFCGIFAQIFHITRFSKIYYKKFLVLGFYEHAISKVPPSIQRHIEDELGILELDRGDSAPYLFIVINDVYVPLFAYILLYIKVNFFDFFFEKLEIRAFSHHIFGHLRKSEAAKLG